MKYMELHRDARIRHEQITANVAKRRQADLGNIFQSGKRVNGEQWESCDQCRCEDVYDVVTRVSHFYCKSYIHCNVGKNKHWEIGEMGRG